MHEQGSGGDYCTSHIHTTSKIDTLTPQLHHTWVFRTGHEAPLIQPLCCLHIPLLLLPVKNTAQSCSCAPCYERLWCFKLTLPPPAQIPISYKDPPSHGPNHSHTEEKTHLGNSHRAQDTSHTAAALPPHPPSAAASPDTPPNSAAVHRPGSYGASRAGEYLTQTLKLLPAAALWPDKRPPAVPCTNKSEEGEEPFCNLTQFNSKMTW